MRRIMPARTALRTALVGVLVLGACQDSPTGPGTSGEAPAEVGSYLSELPGWAEFSPQLPDVPPTATGPADTLPPEVTDVREVEEDGTVSVIPDVTYQCTTTPYTLQDTPQKVVMYSPDAEILWPGGLIQGKSHRDGLGALLGLPIEERAPLRVSIPGFATGDNYREVEHPNQATVSAARGEIVGNATARGLATPSTITFQQRTYHSEGDFALSLGISGHYLGFEGSATGDFSRKASETTVTAQFYQKMYEVVVEPPQTPGAFFSSDFTQAKLEEQIQQHRIGPDNIPVYVSNIVYGRMMMFSFTSTASEEDIRATLSAAYNSIAGGAEVNLSAKQRKLLQEAKIAVTSLGGPAKATIAVIKSGDWSQYFTDEAPLSSAAPISYTFRNLGDGSIASVTEATDYNVKQCAAVPATPGTFAFEPLQTVTSPIPAGVRTLLGDVDGDGRTDLVWNHLGATNEVYVGLANGDGTFRFTTPVSHPESPPEGWANYTPALGDVNGDGRADLIWNYLGAENKTYIGLGNGDGTWSFPSARIHPTTGDWSGYTMRVLDVNADGEDDLVWNILASWGNRTYAALSQGDSRFTYPPYQDRGLSGWGGYQTFTGDLDGDLREDLIWNATGGGRTYLARSRGDGTWTFSNALDNGRVSDWGSFATRVGDIDGDGDVDLVRADTTVADTPRIVIGRSSGGSLSFLPVERANYDAASPLSTLLVGDVDGDGDGDLVWNARFGASNRTFVSLATGSGAFDFTPQDQLHPATDNWEQFTLYLGDVNGDGRADLIWNHAAAENKIYVALARP